MTARKMAGPPTRDRSGYYVTPKGRYMSVTTILSNGIPKPALMHWAALEAAQCAVDNVPMLLKARGQAARDEMRNWIRRAAERKRDTAADLGTTVHGFLESQILGEPTPLYSAEQRPFIDAFGRFLDAWQPEFEASELTVANHEHRYAGTLDAIARIPALGPDLLMLDWKTGKSIYPEVGMQLAAYQRCRIGWTRPAGVEIGVPATGSAMVLHLRPEHMPGGEPGGYAFIPVKTDDLVFETFLAAKVIATAGARDSLFDSILSEPLPAPVKAVA